MGPGRPGSNTATIERAKAALRSVGRGAGPGKEPHPVYSTGDARAVAEYEAVVGELETWRAAAARFEGEVESLRSEARAVLERLVPVEPDPHRHETVCPAHVMHEGDDYAGACDCVYGARRAAWAVLKGLS
jgi:hypothetical protein